MTSSSEDLQHLTRALRSKHPPQPSKRLLVVLNSLNGTFLPPVPQFSSCTADSWGFYIQVLWVTPQRLFCIFVLWVINCRVNTVTQTQAGGLNFDVQGLRGQTFVANQNLSNRQHWHCLFLNINIYLKYYTIVLIFLITHLFAQKTNVSLSQHHKCVWVKKSIFLGKPLDVGADTSSSVSLRGPSLCCRLYGP